MERSTLRRYYMWNLAICSVSVLEGLQILWNVCLFLKLGLGKLRDKDLDIGKSGLVIIAYIYFYRLFTTTKPEFNPELFEVVEVINICGISGANKTTYLISLPVFHRKAVDQTR